MRRATWTVLAAAGLVLMGSDGAVRSDCPPSGQICSGDGNPSCVWNADTDGACNEIVVSSCGCTVGECNSPTNRRIGLNTLHQFLESSGTRPEGCCDEISPWGSCYIEDTRECFQFWECRTYSGGSTGCSKPNNLCFWQGGYIVVRTGYWSVPYSACCVDNQ